MNNLKNIIQNMKSKKILVIGDIMLDKYIWGKVTRMSPEAHVPVVDVEKESYMPGGAANAANNIKQLQANSYLIGSIGNDKEKDILLDLLKQNNINTDGIIQTDNITTQKIRIMKENKQLVRVDYEKKLQLSEQESNKLIENIKNTIPNVDLILISDYSKGLITKKLMENIQKFANSNNKKIIIDPKPINKELYKNCFLLTPNMKEAKEMSNLKDIEEMGKFLTNNHNCNVLITRSEQGISLFEKNQQHFEMPTKASKVFDVSGAGDTFAAALVLSIASDATLKEAATIANHAAGITVGKIGTSTVSLEEIEKSIENDNNK